VQEETEIVAIQGFVSKPEFAKKNRGEQFSMIAI
jgi:DNA mismatch repair protein MutL